MKVEDEFRQKREKNVNFQTSLLESGYTNKGKSSFIAMEKTKIRFIVLAMASLLMFGNNYSFDNPQALQKQIMNDLSISSTQYNLLYSAFSFPNIFLTLAGGIMVDYLGDRKCLFIFTLGVMTTQIIVALGGTYRNYYVMLVGRALFGCCSEVLIITQSTIVSKWFKGSELSMAVGIMMTVPEIASALNSLLSPIIYSFKNDLMYPLFFSVIICFFSFICALILIYFDLKRDNQKNLLDQDEEEEEGAHEIVRFSDIKQFSATFWILLLLCMFILGIYIPFLDDANDFFQEKFKFTSIEAGQLIMIPYLMSTLTSPFFGRLVDKIGKRRYFIMLVCSTFITSQLLFALLPPGEENDPQMFSVIPLAILGISFAGYSCVIIPSVQYVVPQRVMGTAFGIMGMLESISQALFPIIAASIVSSSDNNETGYSNVGFFFAGIGFMALIFSFTLFWFDQKGAQLLDFINPQKPNEQEKLKTLRKKMIQIGNHIEEEDSDEEDTDDEQEISEGLGLNQQRSENLNELSDEEEDDSDEEFKKSQSLPNNNQLA